MQFQNIEKGLAESKLKVKKKKRNHKTTVKSKAQVHGFFIALFK